MPTYNGIADFEDGSLARVSKFLRPHRSESDDTDEGRKNYQVRLDRLYNENFCSPYLFLHWAHMSQSMTLGLPEGNEALDLINSDVTGYRQNAEQTQRERLWLYIRDGRVGTLVDGPGQIAPDKKTAKANRERSYQVIYEARLIRDWAYFDSGARKGQLSKLVLEQNLYQDPRDGKRYRQFRRYTQEDAPDTAFLYEDFRAIHAIGDKNIDDAEGVECLTVNGTQIGGLPYIPFDIMGVGPEESFLKDVWTLNMAHMNLNSVLDHIIYNQGFQRTIFAGMAKEELSKMAEWIATVVSNPDAQVFTIPPGDPVACEKQIARIERHIHRRAKFEFNQLADDTRQVQSADSKSKDMVVQKVIYDNTLDQVEESETHIWQMHADFEGVSPDARDKISVSIEREYGIDDETITQAEERQVFDMARELGVPGPQKEVLKIKVAKQKFVPNETETPDDVRDRLFKEIDEADATASRSGSAFGLAGVSMFENDPQADPNQDASDDEQAADDQAAKK